MESNAAATTGTKKGPQRRDLACPSCGQHRSARVVDTDDNTRKGREIIRRLQCEPCGTKFTTVERVVRQEIQHLNVQVRPGTYEPFARQNIETALDQWVRKTLSLSERDAVVESVCQALELLLASAASGKAGEEVGIVPSGRSGRGDPYVKVDLIAGYVDQALARAVKREIGTTKDRFRSARAQYALGLQGRRSKLSDRQATERRLQDAESVARWLHVTFQIGHRSDLSSNARVPRSAFRWQAPSNQTWRPERVVKNFRPLSAAGRPEEESGSSLSLERSAGTFGDAIPVQRQGQGQPAQVLEPDPRHKDVLRREVVQFNEGKFLDSIRAAFKGRGNGGDVRTVSEWVYLGVMGQRVVRSSQLSAAVPECLRMLDDVAYLRWIAIGKELTVEDLYDEALNLLKYPSPRLEVSEYGAPRLRAFAQEAASFTSALPPEEEAVSRD